MIATECPIADAPILANIPRELKLLNQWVFWGWELRDGRYTKVPYGDGSSKQPKLARAADPKTWLSIMAAEGWYKKHNTAGIGFEFADEGPYFGIDLDKCRDPQTGAIEPRALDIIRRLNTYSEVSPSKTGIKLIGRGRLNLPNPNKPGKFKTGKRGPIEWSPGKLGQIEAYDRGRFFTVTGEVLADMTEIADCEPILLELFPTWFPVDDEIGDEHHGAGHHTTTIPPNGHAGNDALVFQKAASFRNGDKFSRLLAGDWQGLGYPSQSEADVAMCGKLAFLVGPNESRIDSLFRQTGLYRDKWEREDYRGETISLALKGRTEFYDWGRKPTDGIDLRQYGVDDADLGDIMTSPHISYDLDTGERIEGEQPSNRPGGNEPQIEFKALTSAELDAADCVTEYLIEGLFVRGEPGGIFASKKSLKTNTAIDLALSLSIGGRFLNRFQVERAVRVALLSGESGQPTIQETARRIARSKGRVLKDFPGALWGFDVPNLASPPHIGAIQRFITSNEIEVLILDPAYLMMPIGDSAANLFEVGALLKELSMLGAATGATILIIHHTRKNIINPFEPPELENIAWAGFQEWVRQWLLMGRRQKYDPDQGGSHKLWLASGGSAGHSGLWGVDIEEGTRQDTGGRRWDVQVVRASEARTEARQSIDEQRAAAKQTKQAQTLEANREKIRNVLRKRPNGESKSEIRDTAGLHSKQFAPALQALVDAGEIESCEVVKGKRTFDGYQFKKRDESGTREQEGGNMFPPE